MDTWSECQWDEGTEPRRLSRTLVYPLAAVRHLPGEAPEQMRSLYREASLCETAGALRAAGVLYRSATLEHALLSAGASRGREGLIRHWDRGAQYVSLAYSDALITAGVSASVGTVGDSYDNALASERERPLQGRAHPLQAALGVRRGSRAGHDGVGALVKHRPPA